MEALSKEPRPQGGALKPEFLKPETEIPNQVRDDKKTRTEPTCHAEPWTDEDQACFSIQFAFFCFQQTHLSSPSLPTGRQAQEGVFRCDFNKKQSHG
jgi:hypothetical protein